MLAEVIQAPLPSAEALKNLARSVSRFPESVIETACQKLENAPQGEYRRLPTPHEFKKACEESQVGEVKQSRWCGRCTLGLVRSGGEWVRCHCNCELCENGGWEVVTSSGEHFDSRIHARQTSYARRCPKGCGAGLEAA